MRRAVSSNALPPELWRRYGYHTSRHLSEGATRATRLVWGTFGYHTPRFQEWLTRHAGLVPAAANTVGWDAPVAGLTAALHTNGSALLGAAADRALDDFCSRGQREQRSDGLLMIAFHRQGAREFAPSARMQALTATHLPFSALLLASNNPRARLAELLHCLSLFHRPAQVLRLLVHIRMNMGYYCGELHSLSATVRIWSRFP
ncbi:MAG: hypothetical protein SGPRY_008769 [Prymnesium sp.]